MEERTEAPNPEDFRQRVPVELLESYVEAIVIAERLRLLHRNLARAALSRVPQALINTALWHFRKEPLDRLAQSLRAYMLESMTRSMAEAIGCIHVLFTDLLFMFEPERLKSMRKYRCPDLLESRREEPLITLLSEGKVAVIARPDFPRKYLLSLVGPERGRIVSLDPKTDLMEIVRPSLTDVFVQVPLLAFRPRREM